MKHRCEQQTAVQQIGVQQLFMQQLGVQRTAAELIGVQLFGVQQSDMQQSGLQKARLQKAGLHQSGLAASSRKLLAKLASLARKRLAERVAIGCKRLTLAAVASLMVASPSLADRGPVTNLPMPRYVSLKGSEGNARRGPSTSHRIDWVFVRRDMPLQVIGEYDNWRQVRDREGATGWVHYTLLSGVRTVIIDYDMVPMRSSPQDGAAVVAHLESGVIARLGECAPDWCRVSIDGYRGWLRKTAIWGVDPEEVRD